MPGEYWKSRIQQIGITFLSHAAFGLVIGDPNLFLLSRAGQAVLRSGLVSGHCYTDELRLFAARSRTCFFNDSVIIVKSFR